MRTIVISSLLFFLAFPAFAEDKRSNLEWSAHSDEANRLAENRPTPLGVGKLTLVDVSEAIFGVPLPRPRAAYVTPVNVPIAQICETLASAARNHDIPIPFFIRLIWQESRFDPTAVSPVGAQGIAQFMPQVAYAMRLDNAFDPIKSLRTSGRLLRDLMSMFDKNLGLAAAAYNAGPQRILDWLSKGGQLPEETRQYVHLITGHTVEHWRKTVPGKLTLELPKRAPCHQVAPNQSLQVATLVPIATNGQSSGKVTTKVAAQVTPKRARQMKTSRIPPWLRRLAHKAATRTQKPGAPSKLSQRGSKGSASPRG
jgi:hypothetical protein